jgi:hypothetical protein
VKGIGIILLAASLVGIAGCEKDVREPGEPRVLAPVQTKAETRSNAAASGLAYWSPNRYAWLSSECI